MSGLAPETMDMIDRALAEDLGSGDATTDALIAPDLEGRAAVMAKAPGVLAGVEIVSATFHRVDSDLDVSLLLNDGAALESESVIAEVEASVASILKAERTALNFLQRLSGVATETRRYVDAVAGSRARILDTRKTVAGLRTLDKYAVRVGGGHNHRRGLGDGILIKDNHIGALRRSGLDIGRIIERARANAPHTLRIEVEVENLVEVKAALAAGADALLLDNMSLEDMSRAVEMAGGRVLIEASGGIRLDNVREVAATGVDMISIGALTHSAQALDISLELV